MTLKEAREKALDAAREEFRVNESAEDAIALYLRIMDSLGYRLLPKEATEEMRQAMHLAGTPRKAWNAGVRAAPERE